ncbi:MAG: imidazoleglycerol-phosphate dehydratase HisB [Syntrophales bacterium]|nr:imidazoleglycerol-phosphate dehydratase HisB [Syntrophales bacterium]
MKRKSRIERKTAETNVEVEINLDGSGAAKVDTDIPFLDHMLTLFSRHGLFDLTITGRGDRAVDDHHLVEDVGICLGLAISQALGQKEGIERYGEASVPMDESLVHVVVDLSGRPCLIYNVEFEGQRIGDFDPSLIREFFKALADNGKITLHINLLYGVNDHHIAEAIFKGVARALRKAVNLNTRIEGIMSTKGTL